MVEEMKDMKPLMRQVIIETDGAKVNMTKCDCSQLELKEIARQILKQLGG